MANLVDLFRELVRHGIGLAPAGDAVGVFLPITGPVLGLNPELRMALRIHKVPVARLVAEDAVRGAWRVPAEITIGPQLAVILAWLLLERATFARDEWRGWLERKSRDIDAAVPRYIADILATEAIARDRLSAASSPSSHREAA